MTDDAQKLWDQGDVDGAGQALNLPRCTVDGGHPFDESDASYKRRVHAVLAGAAAAGATDPIEDDDDAPDDSDTSADADEPSSDNGTENP
jgi:hypothetical protein